VTEVIDAHIHLSERKDDRLNAYAERNGLKYTLRELLLQMAQNGVVRGLLLSPIVGSGTPLPNSDVLRLCGRSRGKLSPILTVQPDPEAVDGAVRLAKDNLKAVKGFKIMLGYERVYAEDPVFSPLYDYAESAGLPIMYHTGDTADSRGSLIHSHPLTLDALANKRGGLTLIACHFGNPWIDDVAELIYKHENVFADISGLIVGGSRYTEQYAAWLASRLSKAMYFAGGADKVVFGTDYPVTTHSMALSLVDRIEVDARDKKKILSDNAKKVFAL